jgi:hypothetical protein
MNSTMALEGSLTALKLTKDLERDIVHLLKFHDSNAETHRKCLWSIIDAIDIYYTGKRLGFSSMP